MKILKNSELLSISGGMPAEDMLIVGLALGGTALISEITFFGFAGYYLGTTSGYTNGVVGAALGLSSFATLWYAPKIIDHFKK